MVAGRRKQVGRAVGSQHRSDNVEQRQRPPTIQQRQRLPTVQQRQRPPTTDNKQRQRPQSSNNDNVHRSQRSNNDNIHRPRKLDINEQPMMSTTRDLSCRTMTTSSNNEEGAGPLSYKIANQLSLDKQLISKKSFPYRPRI